MCVCVKATVVKVHPVGRALNGYILTVRLPQTLTSSFLFVVAVLTLFWIMLMFALDQKCVCMNPSLAAEQLVQNFKHCPPKEYWRDKN